MPSIARQATRRHVVSLARVLDALKVRMFDSRGGRVLVLLPMVLVVACLACRGSRDDSDDDAQELSTVTSALKGPTRPDRLGPGESLAPGASITSTDGRFTLVCQVDGNLVMYRNRTGAPLWMPLWATHTQGVMRECAMQASDGNFVVYMTNGATPWYSHTNAPENAGSSLFMQGDSNIVIYRPDWTAIWASQTVQPPDRTAFTFAGRLTIDFPSIPGTVTPTPRLATEFYPTGVTRTFKGDTFISDGEYGTVLRVNGDSVYRFSPHAAENFLYDGGAERGPNVTWGSSGVDEDYPTVQPPEVCVGCAIPFEGNFYFALNKGSLTNTAQLTLMGSSIDQGIVTLALTAYVRTQARTSAPNMARVTVEYLNASSASFNPPAVFDSGVLVNSDEWVRIYDARKPPVGTRYAKVTLYANNTGSSTDAAFFDAISLVTLPSSGTVFLHGPRGIVNADTAASPANDVIVANTFNHTIVKLTHSTSSSTNLDRKQ